MTEKKTLTGTMALYNAIGKARIPANLKVVLWALATFRGKDGQIYPAYEAIADRAGLSRKQVERTLGRLYKEQLVSLLPPVPGRDSNNYHISIPKLEDAHIRRTRSYLAPWDSKSRQTVGQIVRDSLMNTDARDNHKDNLSENSDNLSQNPGQTDPRSSEGK